MIKQIGILKKKIGEYYRFGRTQTQSISDDQRECENNGVIEISFSSHPQQKSGEER